MVSRVVPVNEYHRELSSLFYQFRTAQLNAHYYSIRQKKLELWDRILQAVIALSTALSFGVLAFSGFTSPTAGQVSKIAISAAALSLLAFLVSTVVPWVGLSRSLDETRIRNVVWANTAQQLETTIRFVKQARELPDTEGEIAGWITCAEDAYDRAAATLPAEPENKKLVERLSEEIRTKFPDDYVWKAF